MKKIIFFLLLGITQMAYSQQISLTFGTPDITATGTLKLPVMISSTVADANLATSNWRLVFKTGAVSAGTAVDIEPKVGTIAAGTMQATNSPMNGYSMINFTNDVTATASADFFKIPTTPTHVFTIELTVDPAQVTSDFFFKIAPTGGTGNVTLPGSSEMLTKIIIDDGTATGMAVNTTGSPIIAVQNLIAQPLPVTLKVFAAKVVGNVNEITWESGTEQNLRYYQVEKSIDGQSFRALNDATSPNATKRYVSIDATPNNVTYYRLRMTDFDGSQAFSKTVSVARREKVTFQIVNINPNPIVTEAVLSYDIDTNAAIELQMTDINGRIVQQQQLNASKGRNAQTLQMNNLPQGIYFVTLTQGDKKLTERLIKQ